MHFRFTTERHKTTAIVLDWENERVLVYEFFMLVRPYKAKSEKVSPLVFTLYSKDRTAHVHPLPRHAKMMMFDA